MQGGREKGGGDGKKGLGRKGGVRRETKGDGEREKGGGENEKRGREEREKGEGEGRQKGRERGRKTEEEERRKGGGRREKRRRENETCTPPPRLEQSGLGLHYLPSYLHPAFSYFYGICYRGL